MRLYTLLLFIFSIKYLFCGELEKPEICKSNPPSYNIYETKNALLIDCNNLFNCEDLTGDSIIPSPNNNPSCAVSNRINPENFYPQDFAINYEQIEES